MSINYESLDDRVKILMVEELKLDQSKGTLYISKRLTEEGAEGWVALIREAIEQHDDSWLASQLRSKNYIRTHEQRRKPSGGFTLAKVPRTAHDTMAEGEFNRFYARGLCLYVLESGGSEVEIYRGKQVENPRPESQAMIGHKLSASQLLEDLRKSPGVEPALGLPPGPNSGLTIRRI